MTAKILIADDEPGIVDVLTDYLSSTNRDTLAVTDGVQLLEKAREYRPHLIIADVQMPGTYGTAAAKILANDSQTAGIPILFISAHSHEKIKAILPTGERVRFLQKPISLAQLEELVKELLPLGGYAG